MNNKVSVVIPAYNEEETLGVLFGRLFPVLDSLGRPYEVIFVNDGSRDASLAMLLAEKARRAGLGQPQGASQPQEGDNSFKILDLGGNFGQHMAIMAGFQHATGDAVVTLDADLQNPPEEIPRIVKLIDEGHDVVGTIRVDRRDSLFRKVASRAVNRITNRITGLALHDYGCMLRGYRRDIIDIINEAGEAATFIPALAQKFASNPTEIAVAHSERGGGTSKYGLLRLIRLNFDLMTGFSLAPLQAVTMAGLLISALSFLFAAFMLVRRLLVGPEAEGVFTLLALLFLLTGVTILCVGIEGEYVGRIYQEVRKRPRYVVRKVYE
ncbi:MAG: glycosyltransferase [Synergistaceae bacterium]|jgi:undecaprenyl-phosphate 4-deoxy-4-formamido-L-arabinose transferase|nr:glycosyltransferase [Synergistaceae bacterium]